MRIVTFGPKHSRYALIVEKLDKKTKQNFDNTITYYNTDNIDVARDLYKQLKDAYDLKDVKTPLSFDLELNIFDYKECCYRKVMR